MKSFTETQEDNQDNKHLNHCYWKDVEAKPLFINNDDIRHLRCRNIAVDIFTELSVLFEPKVFTSNRIKKLFNDMNDKLYDILLMNATIEVEYRKHIQKIFQYYLMVSEEYECYEVAENIQRFLDFHI